MKKHWIKILFGFLFFPGPTILAVLGLKYYHHLEFEHQKMIQTMTAEMKSVMVIYKNNGYETCADFYDDGNILPSAPYNYWKNGIMLWHNNSLYWLRCNTTVNRPVIIRLKNKRMPDQFIPPLPDWVYIYDDTKAQRMPRF